MPSIDNYLYFVTPCLPSRDIRLALQLVAQFGSREGFFTILHSQRKVFDNYPATLAALKDYYGREKEKTSEAKIHPAVEVKNALRREKLLEGFTAEEKSKIHKVEKIFKGRLLS